jgi:uncharacterized protein YjbI with pentapeptide repeats
MIYKKKIFTEKDIQGQDFNDSIFESCKFIDLTFRFVNFNDCIFDNCDFSESIFDSVGFSGCKFPETKLSFLDFGGASVMNCDFSNAIASGCIFQKFKGGSKSERKNFDLRSCKFEGTDLSGTIFVICNLGEVVFRKSILENAVFERCNLEKTDFREADIAGCGFTDSIVKNTILDMGGFIDFGASKGFIIQTDSLK